MEQILTYRLPDPLPKRRPNEEEYISWQFYVKWQGYAHKDNDWVEGRYDDGRSIHPSPQKKKKKT